MATAFILLGGKRMSAIGDYVHSTAKGYIDYGILRKKKSSPFLRVKV